MRRLLPLVLLVAALAPASADAEPVGTPYRFSDEQAVVGRLTLASAVNGGVLASWSPPGYEEATTTRALGRTGPAGAPNGVARGPGSVVANRRLSQYLGLWEEADYDNGRGSGLFAEILSASGTVQGPRWTIQEPPYEEAVFDTKGVYSATTRQYLVVGRRSIFEFGPAVQTWLLSEQGELVKGVRCCGVFGTGRPDAGVRGDGRYLVVWPQEQLWSDEEGPDPPVARGIWGQWLTSRGELSGGSFLVSSNVGDPRVAMNSDTGEALVVWSDGAEVIARSIGADGRPRGEELAISQMGPPSDPEWQTGTPDVAYNAEAKQFLVVWASGPRRDPYPIGEHVYGQHLNGAGGQIGPNDFMISVGDRAQAPRVASVRSSRDWLVAWGDPTGVARQVTATGQGTTPTDGSGRRPAAPTGLRATVDGQTVNLSWDASTDRDFAYFAVRRDTQPVVTTASWTRVAGNLTSPSAADAPGPGRYWYYVTQVDKSGQTSPKSATVRVDVAAPPAPPVVDPPPAPPVQPSAPSPPAGGSGTPAPQVPTPPSAGPTPGPTPGPTVVSVAPGVPTSPVVVVQGQTPVVAAPASAPGQRSISAAQALRQARTALRLVYKTAFTKARRFKATCRRSTATRRTCTVSWRYKRFTYKGRVVVRLSGNAYATTVSVKRTRLR